MVWSLVAPAFFQPHTVEQQSQFFMFFNQQQLFGLGQSVLAFAAVLAQLPGMGMNGLVQFTQVQKVG
jgi:hypothetical protein